MNLFRLLQARADEGRPVRVGVIGAGKFSSMFLSQARLTPGLHVVGIAELDPEKARQACLRTGWPQEALAFVTSTASIVDDSLFSCRLRRDMEEEAKRSGPTFD
jgi:predicted homoserine dehydrogenase-like protein